MKKEVIKGALFEIFVLKLVLMSGYKLIDASMVDGVRIRVLRKRFAEFKGRGEWHQIDIPVELINQPPLIYPIRMLGEVKYKNRPVGKSSIRAEIGKMKDIQENYFADSSSPLPEQAKQDRRLEVFSFFSASGFNDAAERLAYAHGIRTISYQNNECIDGIAKTVDDIAEYLSKYPEFFQSIILDEIFDYLISGKDFNDYSLLPMNDYQPFFESEIKTSIIGTTASGLTINFISYEDFPDELFAEKDEAYCRIHSEDGERWYLTVNDSEVRFGFSMPEIVKSDFFDFDGIRIYPKKAFVFETINFQRTIKGCQRSLTFKFDNEWFSNMGNFKTKNKDREQ